MRRPDPILITGIPRSGSSMIAGIVEICGASAGITVNPDKAYTKSLHENQYIRGLVTHAFKENLCDPQAQFPLPATDFFLKSDFGYRCDRVLREQQVEGSWYFKDTRLCLIWQEIVQHFQNAKWIVVMRDEQHILNSCEKTGFMAAFSKSYVLQQIGKESAVEGWKWWLQSYKDKIMELQYGANVKFVYPEKMLYGDYNEMQKVIEWAGLTWKEKEVKEFIQPKLRRV